ncbi:MAG: hypothetical protein ACOVO3_10555 [Fluviicola sp.]|jgi:hypothetical protein
MQQKRQTIGWILFGLAMILISIALEQRAFQLPFGIHETADDASYLRPAENWINHGVWKDNSEGPSAYVQRPPLVGGIYAIGFWLSPGGSKVIFMVFAVLLHLIAVRCLNQLLLATSQIWRVTGLLLFTVLPCFFGFLSYSISEAHVVSLIVIGITLFYQNRSGFILGSFLLLIYLFRPVLLLLFLPWFVIRLRERIHLVGRNWKIAFFILLLAVLGWEGRKAYYTGHLLDLHPIYHEANWSTYRPPHEKLSDLFRIWETKPELFHELCGKALAGTLDLKAVEEYCQERHVPLDAATLHGTLIKWAHVAQSAIDENAMTLTRSEQEFNKRIKLLRKELVSEYPWRYYVYTPLQGMKEQLPKSHLNLGIFQETYRGTWLVEFIRIISLLLVVLSFVLLPASIIHKHPLRYLAIGTLIYLVYLFWIQRMNEDRYLLPAFIAAYCVLLFWINSIFKVRKKTA